MKTKMLRSILALCVGAGSLIVLAGCASMDAANQESLLSAAGFKVRTPQTPRQKELYANAQPYKLLHLSVKGKTLYAYKDERKGVAYVGGEAEYQRYHQLAVQQRIAQDYYQAAEMNREAAYGWYGAYGPYVWGAPRYWR